MFNSIRLFVNFILVFSFIFCSEIWEKEIPPSSYLHEYALKKEDQSKKTLRYGSYAMVLFGGYIANNIETSNEAIVLTPIFLLAGTGGIIIDLIRQLKPFDKPKTQAGKEYQKIEQLSNGLDKEYKAYNSLVKLAKDSRMVMKKTNLAPSKEYKNRDDRIKSVISDFMGDIIKKKVKKTNIFQTHEEKLLQDYLDQKPIK